MKKRAFLILHNIRSSQNVGSLFRTADAVGITKIYLTGYSPAPLDKFERPSKEIAKTALGAEKSIPWEKCSFEKCILQLKKEKAQIVAIEQHEKSISYRDIKIKSTVAFVLGNEVTGIEPEIVEHCDVIAELPMRGELSRNRIADGGKESLNVSVAGGVALFQLLGI